MINISDLKAIKLMKPDARYFNWTKSALIYLNLIGLVTLTVVAFQKDKELMDYIGNIPMMMLIMTSISLIIFPIVDIYEYILKKRVCKLLDIDFEESFLTKFSNKEIDEIKDLYIKLVKSGKKEQVIQVEIRSKADEIVNQE
jgi:hypothetical protein